MSFTPSRKTFLARMLGFATAGALAPKAVAASLVPSSINKADGWSVAFRIRPLPLDVARADGSA